ncbi:hypothetical protein FZEAL_5485 [Fusarium zealandicum]|uniref:Nudix hydrolase domain-containing protein n=1 Tax=Fusarium zealandicum TaxID=1053134 RepID=A0A8H4XKI6_9HYPO|nr:hypothetical protein FZEAL_5485 [Fusarium zealandicum]
MASIELAQPSAETTSSPRIVHCSKTGVMLSGRTPPTLDMVSLYGVVEQGNKIDTITLDDAWAFRIKGVDEIVGCMRECVRKEMVWDDSSFTLDQDTRTILLDPKHRVGDDIAASCHRALSDLCLLNRGRFNNCFDSWLTKSESRREFQPIHAADSKRQDLTIPLPARGLFGVITVGVHLNVYTTKQQHGVEVIDQIWVSHRAKGVSFSYSGMLDQVVAGGMDLVDQISGVLSPCVTLKREAEEEAGLLLDLDTKETFMDDEDGRRRLVGSVEQAPAITFYDFKGHDAGCGNQGHLEPGVRFVYDLRVETSFRPRTEEQSIERFDTFAVDEVKQSLRDKRWKPNCGLVMLDFLVRKGLVTEENDDRFRDITLGLRRSLPFEFAQDGFQVLHSW